MLKAIAFTTGVALGIYLTTRNDAMLPECAEIIDAEMLIATNADAEVNVLRMMELFHDFQRAGVTEWALRAAGCAETACYRATGVIYPR